MLLYLISIIGGDAAILIMNLIFCKGEYSSLFIIVASILAAVGVIAIDGVFATVIRRCMPEKWFDYKSKVSVVPKWEVNLCEKLGVKNWKDSVLELGMFTSFSKKKVADPRNREYIERFILECNYGAIIHLANAITGFLLMLCYPGIYIFTIALPACVINFVLSMLPYFILRYNVPRLMRTRDVLEKKELRAAKANAETE